MSGLNSRIRRAEWLVLVVALCYPMLLTLGYFVWAADISEKAQQFSYAIGKLIQFALPVVWAGLICREKLRWPPFRRTGFASGILFGLVINAAMSALYFGYFRGAGTFAAAGREMLKHLSGIGITTPAIYAGVAIFYSLLHSLLEEYYWRWFAFGRLRRLIPLNPAIAISSIAFMAHHVVVLGLYFGWTNPWTWLFSGATAIGGAFWAWLYQKSGSIYGPWASHLLLDAGIFAIGYDLVRAAV